MTLLHGGSRETLHERWQGRNYVVFCTIIAVITMLNVARNLEHHDGQWWKSMLVTAVLIAAAICWRRFKRM